MKDYNSLRILTRIKSLFDYESLTSIDEWESCIRTRKDYESYCMRTQTMNWVNSMRNQWSFNWFHVANAIDQAIHFMIDQTMLHNLTTLRERVTFEVNVEFINKIVARILNFFEKNRTQSKIFLNVQKNNTMTRYVSLWNDIIRFLLKLLTNNDICSILFTRYLKLLTKLSDSLATIKQLVEALHAINSKQLSFQQCLNAFDLNASSHFENVNTKFSKSLRLHAIELLQTINEFFIALIRYRWEQFSFNNFVIEFVVLHILIEEKVWILVKNFSSRINDWIHCMQLWLLVYCVRKWEKSRSFDVNLKHIVREQCRQFLVNTNLNFIVELSYWRLLTWIANNDVVRHSIITINDDCTQINHRTITLSIEIWREELRAMFVSINKFLKNILLLSLNEISHYSINMLIDNSNDLRFEKSFLDDLKNELYAIQNWLFRQLQTNSQIRDRFFKIISIARHQDSKSTKQFFRIRQFKVNAYLLTNQRFLRLLSVLVYWTFDLFSRRKELMNIAWCNQEIARNIHISNDMMTFIINYHKSSWKIESRLIARYFASTIDKLLIRYLIYVSFFLRFLNYCMQYSINRVFLFDEREKIWFLDRFENQLKRQSAFLLRFSINTRQWRHMIIIMNRKMCLSVSCKLYEIFQNFEKKTLHAKKNFDSRLNENFDDQNNAHFNDSNERFLARNQSR